MLTSFLVQTVLKISSMENDKNLKGTSSAKHSFWLDSFRPNSRKTRKDANSSCVSSNNHRSTFFLGLRGSFTVQTSPRGTNLRPAFHSNKKVIQMEDLSSVQRIWKARQQQQSSKTVLFAQESHCISKKVPQFY